MNQNKTRNRAQSAKPYSQRQRPLSSKHNKITQKTGLIQKIYTNIPNLHQRPTSGRNKSRINSLYLASNLSNIPGGTIQKQALLQQNIQLKKKNNALEQEHAKMYGKLQTFKSKISKFNGNLNVQFQNQNLWTRKNAYLVTGVKNQYQNLKTKYKQKCDQLNAIKSINVYTNMKQLQKQNESLKKQNLKIIQTLIQLEMKSSIVQNSSQIFKGQHGKVNQLMINQLQHKVSTMEQKLRKRSQEISNLNQTLQASQTKVKFYEKLVTQKDNSLHALHLKNKRLEKQKLICMDEINQITKKTNQIQDQYEQKLRDIKQMEDKKISKQRQFYSKSIEEKNLITQKLQKEVAYLTTLLSYWKPLDQQKEQKTSSPAKNQKNLQIEEKAEEEKKKKHSKLIDAFSIVSKATGQRLTQQVTQLQKNQDERIAAPRTQKRADKKRVQSAKKVRRVKDNEVQETGELLKFRLIAQRISIKDAKSYFTYSHKKQISEQEQAWQRQYISMRQATISLKNIPFNLTQQQSHLLSRYMVEDVMNDFIYCDEQNQNKRDIVKSIFKNIIGNYVLEKQDSQIEKQTDIELGKYKSKISTILQQLYPGGLVSKKKLIQIFVGSGLQIQEDVLQFIIGKIAMKSETLNNLNYRVIF